jgi:hypothetical protein
VIGLIAIAQFEQYWVLEFMDCFVISLDLLIVGAEWRAALEIKDIYRSLR